MMRCLLCYLNLYMCGCDDNITTPTNFEKFGKHKIFDTLK